MNLYFTYFLYLFPRQTAQTRDRLFQNRKSGNSIFTCA